MTNCVKILTTMLVSTCIWLIQQVDKKEIQVTADQVKLAFKYHTQSCIVYHKIYSTYVHHRLKLIYTVHIISTNYISINK